VLYRQASWNIDAFPDADIALTSPLFILRLAATKQSVDPISHERRLEETELVKRARTTGMSDQDLLSMIPLGDRRNATSPPPGLTELPPDLLASMTPASSGNNRPFTQSPLPAPGSRRSSGNRNPAPSGRDLLEYVKMDVASDISGELRPLSSLNYIWVVAKMMSQFMVFEQELETRRNRLYVRAYEQDAEWSDSKRVGLAYMALVEQDEECLTVMAEEFERFREGFMTHIYWTDLEAIGKWTGGPRDEGEGACSVM